MVPEDAQDPAGGTDPGGANPGVTPGVTPGESPEAGGRLPGAPGSSEPVSPADSGGARSFGDTLRFTPDDISGRQSEGSSWHPEGSTEERPPARSLNEREVKVVNVFQLEDREATFVLLQDGRGRKMPIWIGQAEAVSIYIALQKEQHSLHRPLTHDLLKNIVEKIGAKVERLTIDDIWQETYYARLVLSLNGNWIDIDCRPSDGIAVALRAQAPIYVAEEVLESCKVAED